MKINRKKMETKNWAIGKYEQLLYENKEIEHRINFDIPAFKGEKLSKYLQHRNYTRLERNERKIRQVEMILKKIGVEFE